MKTIYKAVLASTILVLTQSALAVDCEPLEQGSDIVGLICDRENNNRSVIVLIAGLGGEKTWAELRPYITADAALGEYDLFEYYTPKSKLVAQHFEYVSGVIGKKWPNADDIVVVGHSIGGIVVRTLALQGQESRLFKYDPRYVVTYATPYEEERFHRNVVQFLGTFLGYLVGAVQPLQKEAFNKKAIARYTTEWRNSVEQNEDGISERYLAIFGDSDKTSPARNERGKPFIVVIEGNHKNLVKPTESNPCPYLVLRHIIINGEQGPEKCLSDQ